jgi:hypothetical protein
MATEPQLTPATVATLQTAAQQFQDAFAATYGGMPPLGVVLEMWAAIRAVLHDLGLDEEKKNDHDDH